LPESANHGNIQAAYVDGILKISVPEKEEARPQARGISIN
jgi:HSP20 family protein